MVLGDGAAGDDRRPGLDHATRQPVPLTEAVRLSDSAPGDQRCRHSEDRAACPVPLPQWGAGDYRPGCGETAAGQLVGAARPAPAASGLCPLRRGEQDTIHEGVMRRGAGCGHGAGGRGDGCDDDGRPSGVPTAGAGTVGNAITPGDSVSVAWA